MRRQEEQKGGEEEEEEEEENEEGDEGSRRMSSLLQVTCGVGFPDTLQYSSTLSPSFMMTTPDLGTGATEGETVTYIHIIYIYVCVCGQVLDLSYSGEKMRNSF